MAKRILRFYFIFWNILYICLNIIFIKNFLSFIKNIYTYKNDPKNYDSGISIIWKYTPPWVVFWAFKTNLGYKLVHIGIKGSQNIENSVKITK